MVGPVPLSTRWPACRETTQWMGKHSDPWSVGEFVLYIESSVSTGKQCVNSDLMQLALFQVCVPSLLLLSHYSMYGGITT